MTFGDGKYFRGKHIYITQVQKQVQEAFQKELF